MTQKKPAGRTRLELAAERMAQTKALHDSLLAQKRAKEQSSNRKIENRKKILMGSFFKDYVSESDPESARMMNLFHNWLTRDNERALFDLPPCPVPVPVPVPVSVPVPVLGEGSGVPSSANSFSYEIS